MNQTVAAMGILGDKGREKLWILPRCWYCFNEFAQNLVITIVTYRRKISISPQEKEKSLSVTKGERVGESIMG